MKKKKKKKPYLQKSSDALKRTWSWHRQPSSSIPSSCMSKDSPGTLKKKKKKKKKKEKKKKKKKEVQYRHLEQIEVN